MNLEKVRERNQNNKQVQLAETILKDLDFTDFKFSNFSPSLEGFSAKNKTFQN